MHTIDVLREFDNYKWGPHIAMHTKTTILLSGPHSVVHGAHIAKLIVLVTTMYTEAWCNT